MERGDAHCLSKGVLKEYRKKPSKARMIREKCPEPKVVCFQKEWAQAE